MRVIVSAYACEPDKGSEPEVGWQWVRQIARFHDTTVLTRANNRPAIERALQRSPVPNLHFEYVELPRWARFWKRGGRGVHLYYLLWQCWALRRARALHRSTAFDLAHHVTFSPCYQPALLAALPVPFVWGPVGGLEEIPAPFLPMFTRAQRLREAVRRLAHASARFNPLVRLATRRARVVLAATEVTRRGLARRKPDGVVLEQQIGMDPTPRPLADARAAGEPFTVLTAGRHVYWKATILVIRAFAHFVATTGADAKLVVLSKGPETARLVAACERLQIAARCEFKGWLPQQDAVFDYYRRAHVFAYASLLECAGYVALEALSQGLPVVCLDLPGPGEIVDASCGVLVPADEPEATVERMGAALAELHADRQRLARLAEGALQRVSAQYAWDLKGERLRQLYATALGAAR